MTENMKQNKTLKFGDQFVLCYCYAFVTLFLAVHTGNWKLIIAATKSMAALFTGFDRQKYLKLIP